MSWVELSWVELSWVEEANNTISKEEIRTQFNKYHIILTWRNTPRSRTNAINQIKELLFSFNNQQFKQSISPYFFLIQNAIQSYDYHTLCSHMADIKNQLKIFLDWHKGTEIQILKDNTTSEQLANILTDSNTIGNDTQNSSEDDTNNTDSTNNSKDKTNNTRDQIFKETIWWYEKLIQDIIKEAKLQTSETEKIKQLPERKNIWLRKDIDKLKPCSQKHPLLKLFIEIRKQQLHELYEKYKTTIMKSKYWKKKQSYQCLEHLSYPYTLMDKMLEQWNFHIDKFWNLQPWKPRERTISTNILHSIKINLQKILTKHKVEQLIISKHLTSWDFF